MAALLLGDVIILPSIGNSALSMTFRCMLVPGLFCLRRAKPPLSFCYGGQDLNGHFFLVVSSVLRPFPPKPVAIASEAWAYQYVRRLYVYITGGYCEGRTLPIKP